MMSEFAVDGFNAETVEYFPRNDYARVQDPTKPYGEWEWDTQTGLEEGFHVLRARAFIKRIGNLNPLQDGAPIYNTYVRTFYYDAGRPEGGDRLPDPQQHARLPELWRGRPHRPHGEGSLVSDR